MILCIIWDAGGTLFDTYPATTQAFLSALAQHGLLADARQVGELARVSQRHAAETLSRQYGLDADAFWRSYREFLARADPADMPPFPGVRDVCVSIASRGGLNLIATHRGPESVNDLLRVHGLTPLFADVITTAQGYPRKPDPAMLNALVERYSLSRATTLAVGDREIDIAAGRAAGLRTCLFRGKSSLPADLQIESYAELLPWLAG